MPSAAVFHNLATDHFILNVNSMDTDQTAPYGAV